MLRKWSIIKCPHCKNGINSVSHICYTCDGKGFVKIRPIRLKELKEWNPK